MGEAMSARFDGKVVNPYGISIDLPHWVFVRLKRLKLLDRDIETGMYRIKEQIFGLIDLWEGPDFGPARALRASTLSISARVHGTADTQALS